MEHKSQALLHRRGFIQRLAKHIGVSVLLIIFSLGVGVAGYHFLADFTWIDSFLNASMILGGMGEVGELTSNGAKIFAAFYALFAGIVFIALGGILIAPIFHRMLHILHVESEGKHKKLDT